MYTFRSFVIFSVKFMYEVHSSPEASSAVNPAGCNPTVIKAYSLTSSTAFILSGVGRDNGLWYTATFMLGLCKG